MSFGKIKNGTEGPLNIKIDTSRFTSTYASTQADTTKAKLKKPPK